MADKWQSLFREIQSTPEGYDPVSPPVVAEIEKFEADFKFRLPGSYRTFISLFGAGELSQEFKILAPGCETNPHYDITRAVSYCIA